MDLTLVNMFMSATMVSFVVPFVSAIYYRMYMVAILILLSGGSSAFYHLHESQKHRLNGAFPGSEFSSVDWNWVLINFDRVFALLLMLYMGWVLLASYNYDWEVVLYNYAPLGGLAIGCMTISETIYRDATIPYIVYHTIWHTLAAVLLYRAINDVSAH